MEGRGPSISLLRWQAKERGRTMIIQNGKVLVFEEGGFVPKDIRVEGSIIKEVADRIQPEGSI